MIPYKVLNIPHFAPIYNFRDKDYLSPWQIITEKGYLKIHPTSSLIIDHPDFLFCPPNVLIDKEIKRVYYFWNLRKLIKNQDTFITSVANAMKEDACAIETMFPDYTILALVGGKDSMNMLLLPWKNPVIVASGEPNYPLVRTFLKKNGLNFEMIRLDDEKNLDLEKEILLNCCRLNLEHCRWTGHLDEISEHLEKKVVILKGQGGDNFFTDKWKKNLYPAPDFHCTGKVNRLINRIIEKSVELRERHTIFYDAQKLFFNNLWYEGAHWQGVHMSFLHEYTGVPVLSMYHNAHVMDVLTTTDFEKVVTSDIRKQIGEKIFGGPVYYPDTNPAPPVSAIRRGLCQTKPFLELIKKYNIKIV